MNTRCEGAYRECRARDRRCAQCSVGCVERTASRMAAMSPPAPACLPGASNITARSTSPSPRPPRSMTSSSRGSVMARAAARRPPRRVRLTAKPTTKCRDRAQAGLQQEASGDQFRPRGLRRPQRRQHRQAGKVILEIRARAEPALPGSRAASNQRRRNQTTTPFDRLSLSSTPSFPSPASPSRAGAPPCGAAAAPSPRPPCCAQSTRSLAAGRAAAVAAPRRPSSIRWL